MKNTTKLVKYIHFFVLAIFAGTFFLSCNEKTSPPDSAVVAAVSAGVLGRKEPLIV